MMLNSLHFELVQPEDMFDIKKEIDEVFEATFIPDKEDAE
jgi:hypothetical protein